MRAILIRLLLFSSPFLVLIALAEFQLYRLGESRSVRAVLAEQNENADREVLFMRGVLDQDFNIYKMSGLDMWQPEIMILGSSRVMQFRKLHFNEDYSFYNAGGILQCVEDLAKIVELFETGRIKKPDLLIVGLDIWWFKEDGLPNRTWLDEESLKDDAWEIRNRLGAYKKIYSRFNDLYNLKYENNIGGYAKVTNGGFRKDGSKAYESDWILEFIDNPVYRDRENPPVIERIIESKTNRFSVSNPDTSRIQMAMDAADRIKEMGIELVVFFPPFSNESWLALDSMEVYKELLHYVYDMSARLEDLDIHVIESSAPAFYGLEDTYFIDGFHPGEVFVGNQLLEYFSRSNELKRFINPKLRDFNSTAVSPLTYERPD